MTFELVLEKMQNYIFQMLGAVVIALIGYLIVKIILAILKKIFKRTKIEHTAVTFVLSAVKVILYIIIIIAILSKMGVNVDSIITTVGAAALTAGLALQSTLSNIASGIIILFTKPFVAGDRLELNGSYCVVENIKLFTTTVHTLDNKIITIPNSKLTSDNVINCTMIDKRRIDLKYTVSYEDDIDKVRKVILNVASENEIILKSPAPEVYVGEHLENGLQILVWVWGAPDKYFDIYYYMQENVKSAFDKNNITIPYPHIVLKNKYFDNFG